MVRKKPDRNIQKQLRLNSFLVYWRNVLTTTHPNCDYAVLLSGENFDNNVLGKAFVDVICSRKSSGGIAHALSKDLEIVASTVAHEMGHSFGMHHDNNDTCPDNSCIMLETIKHKAQTKWSSSSVKFLESFYQNDFHECLKNKPVKLFESPICGNGFVEPGEECDCGLPKYCDNRCCNAETCMLNINASCATGRCCDLKTCKPHLASKKYF